MADPELRAVATPGELRAAAERLSLPAVAVAPALVEPALRLLADGAGAAMLLRRQWAGDGTAEAVVLHRAGVPLDHPTVVATAVAWGCDQICHAPTGRAFTVPAPAAGAGLVERFRHLAALAATRVEIAVALAGDDADEAAHAAATAVLAALRVPLLSEERGDVPVPEGSAWIVLDPVDGTGNLSAGESVVVPAAARRVRITGCTAIDLCLVADGSAAAWHDLDRSGSHVHDVAGGLGVLLAAGGVALDPDGEPLLLGTDSGARVRFVAAPDDAAAGELLARVSER